MQVWKPSESLDFIESWMTFLSALKGNLNSPGYQRKSYAQQLLQRVHSDEMGPFMESYWLKK
jgi:hypothetical protein